MPFCAQMAYHCYEQILRIRLLDATAVNLHRQGQMGTYPTSLGQEAIDASLSQVLTHDDVVAPYYRSHGLLIHRGLPAENILLYWAGYESRTHNHDDFPICIPIGTQCPHAVGAAYAARYRGDEHIAVACIGDGGTSRGDFFESLNAANLFSLPLIIVVNNNQWALTTKNQQQSQLTSKALAFGLRGFSINGNDCFELAATFKYAKQLALQGQPCLVEAITYRLSDHTTIDDANSYRSSLDVATAWKHEPLIALRQQLIANDPCASKNLEAIETQLINENKAYVKRYEDAIMNQPEVCFALRNIHEQAS